MATDALVWHYTTTDGLLGMLTKHTLWASSVSFMNDPTEDGRAYSVVGSALSEVEGSSTFARGYFLDVPERERHNRGFSRRFAVCASRAEDALEMWRAYGSAGVQGTFAVGLDPAQPLGPLVEDASPHDSVPPAAILLSLREGWRDVQYESDLQAIERAKLALSRGSRHLIS